MAASVVLVACAAAAEVAAFVLDAESGALAPAGRTPVAGAREPVPAGMPLAISTDRRRLYAGWRNPPYPVSCFDINADGSLSRFGTGHLFAPPAYLATDAAGGLLFAASYHGGLLAVHPIGADGVPGAALQVFDSLPKAHSVLPDPEGRAIYAAVLGSDHILRGALSTTAGRPVAALTVAAVCRRGAGPRHLRFAHSGRSLYAVNELDGTITAYARDGESGVLGEVQTLPLAPGAASGHTLAAADLHLTPDERFLYANERAHALLAGFRLGADGRLVPAGAVSVAPEVRSFAIDPSGRWLVAASFETGALLVWERDGASGALRPAGVYPAGGRAAWVEIVSLPG
jgi:6-phosphogluconolactonase